MVVISKMEIVGIKVVDFDHFATIFNTSKNACCTFGRVRPCTCLTSLSAALRCATKVLFLEIHSYQHPHHCGDYEQHYHYPKGKRYPFVVGRHYLPYLHIVLVVRLVDSVVPLHHFVTIPYRPPLTIDSVAFLVNIDTVFLVGLYRVVLQTDYHAVPILRHGQAGRTRTTHEQAHQHKAKCCTREK